MALYDDLRTLAASLMAEFAVPAALYRVSTTYDPVTDVAAKHETSTPCLAVLAPRKTKAENGALVVETTARLTVEPMIGDRLALGVGSYIVLTVEAIAPDGGEPMLWIATLR